MSQAIESVPPDQIYRGFYSRFFLVPKKLEGVRLILDLRNLNKFIYKEKFCMYSLGFILPLLQPGDWIASLDLQDAYTRIPIHPEDRK